MVYWCVVPCVLCSAQVLMLCALVCLPCRSQREVINEMPLYPTESIMFDEHQIPSVNYTGEGCLALPKLNLQFLTAHDYLLRNFNLFRLEATYEVGGGWCGRLTGARRMQLGSRSIMDTARMWLC